jgi:hypothetical protein
VMEEITVNSSNISSVAHEGDKMRVTFKHGGTYEYSGVDKDMFNDLLAAPSIGKFLSGMGIKGIKLEGGA